MKIKCNSDEFNRYCGSCGQPFLFGALKAAIDFIDSHVADHDITIETCEKYSVYQDELKKINARTKL